jgi:hypothetical protein
MPTTTLVSFWHSGMLLILAILATNVASSDIPTNFKIVLDGTRLVSSQSEFPK